MTDRALINEMRDAIEGLNPLTGYGEDAVWRPANRAWEALRKAADRLEALTGGEVVAWRRRPKDSGRDWTLFADADDEVEFYRSSGRYDVQPLYLSPPSEAELVQELHELGGRPGREEIARKLAALRGHRDIDAMIWISDAQREDPVWRLYLEQADAILALFDPPPPSDTGGAG